MALTDLKTDLDVQPLDKKFGVRVNNIDAATASDAELSQVVEVFHHYGALLMRDQNMEPEDLIHYLSQFGPLEGHTEKRYTLEGFPEIFLLSNIEKNGKPIGAHFDGVGWHTDYSYMAEPVMTTMLYAKIVPDEGSDTLMADCVAAYDALPDDMKEKLEGLQVEHSYKYFMETREHGGRKLTPEEALQTPDVSHPLIRTHPADGRKALWPSTGTVKGVTGMDPEEGRKLMEELVDFVTQDRFIYRHKWRAGDLLMWDNRCTLHTGTLFDDKKYKRLMHRLWVKGDRPF